MRVGIIDVLSDDLSRNWGYLYRLSFQKQSMSIMPQVISVWCRQLGHEVHYTTFYGQKDPMRLLPDDLDVVVCCVVHASKCHIPTHLPKCSAKGER